MLHVHCDIFARGTMSSQPPTHVLQHMIPAVDMKHLGYLYSDNIDDGFSSSVTNDGTIALRVQKKCWCVLVNFLSWSRNTPGVQGFPLHVIKLTDYLGQPRYHFQIRKSLYSGYIVIQIIGYLVYIKYVIT